MGLFLTMGIVKNCNYKKIKSYVSRWIKKNSDTEIVSDKCIVSAQNDGIFIGINDYPLDSEGFFKYLSEANGDIVMNLYIYNGDFWGYLLYDKGEEIDSFNPIPDYIKEVNEQEKKKSAGNIELVANCFGADKSELEKFLVIWPKYSERKNYSDVQARYFFNPWAVVDFMKLLGYDYVEDEE